MSAQLRFRRTPTLVKCLGLVLAVFVATPAAAIAQCLPGTENGEWRYLGGDAGHTRSSALTQINTDNFADLQQAWIWRGDNFGPNVDYFPRSTPIYVDGILYTVATPRRQVVAIDPATGETLWTFREPDTVRHLRSPRQAYGKGVAYAEVDRRGVIFITTPAFFLGDLLVQTRALSQGGALVVPDAPLGLHARDKRTGEILASVPLPAPGQYGMMTYMHEGKQYIVVQIGSIHGDFPGSLVALTLP